MRVQKTGEWGGEASVGGCAEHGTVGTASAVDSGPPPRARHVPLHCPAAPRLGPAWPRQCIPRYDTTFTQQQTSIPTCHVSSINGTKLWREMPITNYNCVYSLRRCEVSGSNSVLSCCQLLSVYYCVESIEVQVIVGRYWRWQVAGCKLQCYLVDVHDGTESCGRSAFKTRFRLVICFLNARYYANRCRLCGWLSDQLCVYKYCSRFDNFVRCHDNCYIWFPDVIQHNCLKIARSCESF